MASGVLLSNAFPTKLFDLESRKAQHIFSGNIEDLHIMRALALLENDVVSFQELHTLITNLENASNLMSALQEHGERLVQISMHYSREFRKNPVLRGSPEYEKRKENLRYVLRPQLIAYRAKMQDITSFSIYGEEGGLIAATGDTKFQMPTTYLDILDRYSTELRRLQESRKSHDAIKRKVSNTICHCAQDIIDINSASSQENVPLTALLGISTIESTGLRYAVGATDGEVGRFQIKPTTADSFREVYPDRFGIYSSDELLERLVRDPNLNATFAAIILNDTKLDYPEKVAGYNKGAKQVAEIPKEEVEKWWYVQFFKQVHEALEQKQYLS